MFLKLYTHVPATIRHQHKKFEEKQREKKFQLFSYISEYWENRVEING
jgi:hypothetical protein